MPKKHNYPSTRANTQTNAGRKGFLKKGRDITTRLPEAIISRIDQIASKEDKSRSAVMRWLLIKALSNYYK